MNKRIVFIPVETIARELDYKIILASKLASEDNLVFLGQHDFLDSILNRFNNGTYIGKHVFKDSFPCSINLYKKYKKRNFSIAWLHEEGGIYAGDKANWKKVLDELLDSSVLKSNDCILTWGEFQKKHYLDSTTASIKNIGVPRFNLSSKSSLRSIINKFNRVVEKDYVLINTNFSTVNYHSDRENMLFNLKNSFKTSDEEVSLIKHFASQNKIFSYFIDLVIDLAKKYPYQLFVFRPHPTESDKIYNLLFSNFKNIKVSKEFSAVEWMDKCKCLIQNGCTTSLEAHFMGKKILNYFPFDDVNSINITRELGVSCKNLSEIETEIFNEKNNLNSKNNLVEIPNLIDNFNENYSEDEFVSVLLKQINKKEKFKFNYFVLVQKIKLTAALRSIINAFKYLPRYLFYKTKWEDYKMAISHFPGLSRSEIVDKFKFLSDSDQNSHNLEFIGKDLVIVSRKNQYD